MYTMLSFHSITHLLRYATAFIWSTKGIANLSRRRVEYTHSCFRNVCVSVVRFYAEDRCKCVVSVVVAFCFTRFLYSERHMPWPSNPMKCMNRYFMAVIAARKCQIYLLPKQMLAPGRCPVAFLDKSG